MNQNRPAGSPPSGVSISPVSPSAPPAAAAASPASPPGRAGGLRFEAFWGTDPGRSRDHNEDAISGTPPEYETAATRGHLFIVADGMGGHNAGEVASNEAIKRVYSRYYADTDTDLYRSLERAMRTANNELFQQAQANPAQHGMGTTMTAAVIQGNHLLVAHVGDSRLYLVRGGKIETVTHDHSWVEEQVRAGVLTRLQAESHPQRNVITRALATGPDVRVDREERDLQAGDVLVYNSDGLNTEVGDAQIAAHATKASSAAEAVQRLIQLANDNGGEDNVSVGVIRVLEATGAGPAATGAAAGNRRNLALVLGAAALVLVIGGVAFFGSGLLRPSGTAAVIVPTTATVAGAVTATPAPGVGHASPTPGGQSAGATLTATPTQVAVAPAATSTLVPTDTPTPKQGGTKVIPPAHTPSGGSQPPPTPAPRALAAAPRLKSPSPNSTLPGGPISFSWDPPEGYQLKYGEGYVIFLWQQTGNDPEGWAMPALVNACDPTLPVRQPMLQYTPSQSGTYRWTVRIVDTNKPILKDKCEFVSEQPSPWEFIYQAGGGGGGGGTQPATPCPPTGC